MILIGIDREKGQKVVRMRVEDVSGIAIICSFGKEGWDEFMIQCESISKTFEEGESNE